MRIRVVVSGIFVALLAACASEPGMSRGEVTVAKLNEACLPIETKEAQAGSGKKAPKSESDAKAYAEYVCNAAAESCSRDPTDPTCQRNLKLYGLIK